MSINFRNLYLAVSLTLGLGLGNQLWGALGIAVSPSPLITGQSFTIAATASDDVTQAIAMVDFRPGDFRLLQIPLVKQGAIWTGFGVVPPDLQRATPAGAMVRVLVFNASRQRFEAALRVGVEINSISAVLANGVLTVTGDDQDNTLAVTPDAAGTISVFVNGSLLAVAGGVPTTNNTSLVRLLGLGGNDMLLVDDLIGPMPPAHLLGGDGDDTLTGSASADELDGASGNDTLLGRGGIDRLIGGPDDDTLIGGVGVDEHFGGEGDDQFVWNPGDGNDLIEGQDGKDTMVFNGANVAEIVDVSTNGLRLRFFRNPGNIIMDCDGIEQVVFRALGGADEVSINDLAGTKVTDVLVDLSNSDRLADSVFVNGTDTNDVITVIGSTNEVQVTGLAALVTVIGGEQGFDGFTVNALGGLDIVDASAVQAGAIDLTLGGGFGNDTLIGGQGNDLIVGGQGIDVMFGEAGDDTFPWIPGDGSDVVEGRAGQDTMLFVGSGANEMMDISANGSRLRFTRNVGSITMDCNEVEVIQVNALGSPDTIFINDLTGTGVTRVDLDLANPPASGLGDNEADTIFMTGTTNNDVVTISGTPAGVSVLGLSAIVNIVGSEPTLDQLILMMLAGDDVVSASDLVGGVIKLTVNGGPGADVLTGSAGDDSLFGDEDDDVLIGGPGIDVLNGGPGDNIIIQD